MPVPRVTAVARRAFIGAAVLWSLALPLSTWTFSRPSLSPFLFAGTAAVYAIGSAVCHQLPARSIHLWGVQMPVCARCTGIYLGAAVVAVIAALRARPLVREHARTALLLGALPGAATLVYEWTTGMMPSHAIRALSGVALGAAVSAIVLGALDNQVN